VFFVTNFGCNEEVPDRFSGMATPLFQKIIVSVPGSI